MIWLVGGLALLLLLVMAARLFANARIETLKTVLRWVAVVFGVILGGFLLFTGRGSQALFTLLFAGPLVWNMWKRFQAQKTFTQGGRASPGQASRVETRTLRMELDHDTGTMTGTVLSGPWRGRDLSELTLSEMLALYRDCRADDPESLPLLETWMDRAFPDWRDTQDFDGGAQGYGGGQGYGTGRGGGQGGGPGAAPAGSMSRAEAFSVLGLSDTAQEAEIRAAYLRLMQAAHPDRGGSAWLAARLNEARKVLLG